MFRHVLAGIALGLTASAANAGFESWRIDELYSNADGTLQYVVLKEAQGMNGMNNLNGLALTSTHAGTAKVYHFGLDLGSAATANKRVLIATQAVAATGLITPDYVMPDRFLPTDGGTLGYAGVDSLTYMALPIDGVTALFAGTAPGPITGPNVATNFAGAAASLPAGPITVVEFYNAALDHYFISPLAPDIDALDTGHFAGWARTGFTFEAYPTQAAGGAGVNPVCRFYIPPQHGDSHFFSASPAECASVLAKVGTDPNYSGYSYETPNAFFIALPDLATGACPSGTIPVYRLWNNRAVSNHRFTTDPVIKMAMLAKGYVAEGYGTDAVSMCASGLGQPDPQFAASAASPFAPGCDGAPVTGALFENAEVEPMVAVNPTNPSNVIGVWQQDRWSNGGAHGLLSGYSFDGGRTWARSAAVFSRCAGGNAANGGNYDRASDPWVTFAPDGTAYSISLSFSGQDNQPGSSNAILVARSTDGGRTWSIPTTLILDGSAALDDKESITADPTDAHYVYATWDRLAGNLGPTYLARTADGGATWEPARAIYDPGANSQTINNQIVVLPNGTLINFFTLFNPSPSLAVIRSIDKGVTWSAPIIIAQALALGVQDPENGTGVRDSATLASIAVGKQGVLVAAWQDSRFSAGLRDGIALSRSTDGGLTWSPPVQVNRVPAVQAFSPTVTIRDDGTIGVTYFDFRNNTMDPTSLPTDLWLTQSSDGVTWRESHVSGPFDLSIAPFAQGLFLGDYHALTSIGATFVPFYVQTNNGNLANRTDAFASLVNLPGILAKAAPAAPMIAREAAPWVVTPEDEQRLLATAKRVRDLRRFEHGGFLPSSAP